MHLSALKLYQINYLSVQDSVVFVEDVSSAQECGQSQKKLRSLNEVLGKSNLPNKASKNAPGKALI